MLTVLMILTYIPTDVWASGQNVQENEVQQEETDLTVIVEVRKEILINAIKKGLSMKEIYPLLGYPEPSNVYWFAKRFLGMSFNDFYHKTRKEI